MVHHTISGHGRTFGESFLQNSIAATDRGAESWQGSEQSAPGGHRPPAAPSAIRSVMLLAAVIFFAVAAYRGITAAAGT